MLSMFEEEKKLILLQHYFLYVLYNGAREKMIFEKLILLSNYLLYGVCDRARQKTHSVITLFFVFYL